jgi:ferrous iron transport protein B
MKAKEHLGDDPEIVLADSRYDKIGKILKKALIRGDRKWAISDLLDKVFLNKYVGIPAFFALLWAVFQFTFEASGPFMGLIEMFFTYLASLAAMIPNEVVASILGDGIFGGLGFILTFIVPIFFLFFSLAILEDSGYLARVAFVFDKLLFKLGLHGRSFIPMLLGFGCNVPAIMAARSIEGKKDRLITILAAPFMSCSARLPVYVLVAGAFFAANAATAVWSMYIIGIFVAILFALLLRRTILKGEPAPFIVELPTYKMPTLHSATLHMWERGVHFLKKAGTYLLVGAMIIWALSVLPWGVEPGSGESLIGVIGQGIQPLFAPLGFTWEISGSLIFAFMAKEVLVESLGVIYAVGSEASIQAAMIASITPVSAYALMVFMLLYVPCLATIGVIKKETGSWKWTAFSAISQCVIAYLGALVVVAIGGLIFGI